jgi:peptide/nickel transport system permease protein
MTDAAAAPAPARLRRPKSPWRDVWDQFRTHRGALMGALVLALILLFCFLGPLVWPHDPITPNIRNRFQPPSLTHPFGTDQLGRDLFARMMQGGQVSLTVGLAAMALSVILGTLIGVLAGYFRRVDGPLMRLTDLFLSLPLLPLLLVMSLLLREELSGRFGPKTGMFLLIVVAIAVTSWMQTARIVRGDVLALKEREFVLAARSIGTPSRRIIIRHIVPNVLSPVLVSATLMIATAIITESALSFLGLGFPPDFPTWGRLVADGMDRFQSQPMWAIIPGGLISLTVLSVNYIGDGLRDALDPRIRGR